MLCYLSYKLNCARHGNFHTMKKSAKTDYLKMLKDNWEANKKGVNETYLFLARYAELFLKIFLYFLIYFFVTLLDQSILYAMQKKVFDKKLPAEFEAH